MVDFEIHKTYSFDTVSPTILNGRYENLRLISIGDMELASLYSDVITTNTMVKNSLTNPSFPNIDEMTFLLFKNITTGEKVALSRSWIISSTVELVVSRNLDIRLKDVSDKDVAIITTSLKSLGYTELLVELT